jgi:hypothetical protein
MNRKGFSMTEHSAAVSPQTLTARVQTRVDNARLAVDRRADAARANTTPEPQVGSGSIDSLSVDEVREFQSLRRVFRDLGVTYRRYRRQTGNKATPGLRDAAYNFRAEPSLPSLVAVAAFLDKLDLLT